MPLRTQVLLVTEVDAHTHTMMVELQQNPRSTILERVDEQVVLK